MFDKLKSKLQSRRSSVLKAELAAGKNKGVDENHDSKMEALTFAEAGEHQLAQETILLANKERAKILMVGKEDMFTGRLMDYTIGLAERFGYDIIAMNITTVAGYTGRFLSPFKKHLREEFEKRSGEAFSILAEKLRGKDIRCEHVVKYNELNRAVEELQHEIRPIEFVVAEPEGHPEKGETEVSIPVFCMQN